MKVFARRWLSQIVFISATFFSLSTEAKMSISGCECPKVTCNEMCEVQTDLTFYSEKCGKNGGEVKSCARPQCTPMKPLPNKCLKLSKYTQKPQRKIASKKGNKKDYFSRDKAVFPVVAEVDDVENVAWKKHEGNNIVLKKRMTIREQDVLETGSKGKLQIKFKDGNVLTLTPKTKLKVTTMIYQPERQEKRTVLDLLKGKIRNKVHQKYKGANSHYRVRTKSAVAGVRGTDFVVSFGQLKNQKIETKIETLTGDVTLMSPDETQKISIKKGQYASFVATADSANVFDDEDISEFVNRGYLTPVYEMNEDEIEEINKETELFARTATKPLVPIVKSICSQPMGEINQCAWFCVNNPKGEKVCRAELPNVQCIRKRCNANGDWADETRLPSSFKDTCVGNKVLVGPCDY